MFVFHGEYSHSLDGKGRVIVPVRCREPIQGALYLTRGLDGCLWLFPMATWKLISARLGTVELPYREARLLERILYSGVESSLDRQGRVLIPPSLREHAGLSPGEPVILVGVKNRLELWEPQRWQEETALLTDGSLNVDERLREIWVS